VLHNDGTNSKILHFTGKRARNVAESALGSTSPDSLTRRLAKPGRNEFSLVS
jgi:hypothetical protein